MVERAMIQPEKEAEAHEAWIKKYGRLRKERKTQAAGPRVVYTRLTKDLLRRKLSPQGDYKKMLLKRALDATSEFYLV